MQYVTSLLRLMQGQGESVELLPGVHLNVEGTRMVLSDSSTRLLLSPAEQRIDLIYLLASKLTNDNRNEN